MRRDDADIASAPRRESARPQTRGLLAAAPSPSMVFVTLRGRLASRRFGRAAGCAAAIVVGLALAATAGCSRSNPAYCAEDDDCPSGESCNVQMNECIAGLDAGACEIGACPEGVPICDEATAQCRNCDYGGDGDDECAAQTEDTPACSEDGLCVECAGPDHCPADAPLCEDEACVPCTEDDIGDAACAERDDDLPRCVNGACAECRESEDCGPDAPICEDGACRPCERGDDCESGVCDTFSGACAAEGDIVLVDGSDPAAGDRPGCGDDESPCASIAGEDGALDQIDDARGFVLVRPVAAATAYIEDIVLAGDPVAELVVAAEGEVRIEPADAPVATIEDGATLSLDGAELAIEGRGQDDHAIACEDGALRVDGLAGPGGLGVAIADFGDEAIRGEACDMEIAGVTVEGGGDDHIRARDGASLEIRDSEVQDGEAAGIRASSDAAIAVFDTLISDQGGAGIDSSGGEVVIQGAEIVLNEGAGVDAEVDRFELRRSEIVVNDLGGVEVRAEDVQIVNNLIARNGFPRGGGSGDFGGVLAEVEGDADADASFFGFNTIVANNSAEGAGSHGVTCAGAAGVVATSNIVHLGEGDEPSVSDDCAWAWSYSNIESGGLEADVPFGGVPQNTDGDPELRDPGDDDFRLTAGSPCVDRGDPDADVDTDLRGEPRPVGESPDCGAYELQDRDSAEGEGRGGESLQSRALR